MSLGRGREEEGNTPGGEAEVDVDEEGGHEYPGGAALLKISTPSFPIKWENAYMKCSLPATISTSIKANSRKLRTS
jgi:hypothetical protein